MDPDVLSEKPESLRRCVERIEARRASSVEELAGDPDRQESVALNLIRAAQLCIDMAVHVMVDSTRPPPSSMGDAFTALADEGVIDDELATRMRAAVGFRNVAVHAYQRLDWSVVHGVSHEGLADIRRFAAHIAALVESPSE